VGERVRLTSADGFGFDAWREPSRDARRGGLVVLHAMWGVTPHLKALAAGFAEQGYEVLVPSLIDRFEPGFPDQDVDTAAYERKWAHVEATDWDAAVRDAQAAVDALEGPVFVMGFCWGATAAWLAASRCTGIAAVSAFYGHQIAEHLDETPKVPTILHLGRHDEFIPAATAERIAEAYPDLPIFTYDAGHAFMAPNGYVKDAAELARLRTLQLFHRSAGKAEMGG
jgi:carboxymethylenebutenolidase